MVSHEHSKDLLVSLVLGELSEAEGSEIRVHAAACDECRTELRRLERLLEVAGRRKSLSAPESQHESAREDLLAAVCSEDETERKTIARPALRRAWAWRRIMTSSIAKMAVAAGVVVVIGLFGLSRFPTSGTHPSGAYDLLSKACAAEETLFAGTRIVHIQNEIVVQALGAEASAAEPNEMWLPMCSLKPDGKLRAHQLRLPAARESYVVTDHSWYDPLTGCFARVLKAGDAVVFGNAYDGRFIYDATVGPGRAVQIAGEAMTGGFKPPQSPAEYLGIAPGLKAALNQDPSAVQSVEPAALADGTPVHSFKLGLPHPDGQSNNSWWLFKVRDDDTTIAEIEVVLLGRPRLLIRRVLTESVAAPGVSWNLNELEGTGAQAAQPVSVTPDMVIPNVSVQHMVERARFETYVFAAQPAWTDAIQITDCIDPAGAGGRMFILTARAEDHRHLVLVQSPTYNNMLGPVVKAGTVVYTSPNGFKVWGGGPQKWYSQILLQSARAFIKDPPSEDRIGYVLESPAGTFPALAINGPVTDDELHKLVDSLIPARDYLKSRPNQGQE
jgi:hypothetical protein